MQLRVTPCNQREVKVRKETRVEDNFEMLAARHVVGPSNDPRNAVIEFMYASDV